MPGKFVRQQATCPSARDGRYLNNRFSANSGRPTRSMSRLHLSRLFCTALLIAVATSQVVTAVPAACACDVDGRSCHVVDQSQRTTCCSGLTSHVGSSCTCGSACGAEASSVCGCDTVPTKDDTPRQSSETSRPHQLVLLAHTQPLPIHLLSQNSAQTRFDVISAPSALNISTQVLFCVWRT